MVSLKKNIPSLGFGLIELIVSLSIVTIVTGIVVAKHNAFNGAILLRNQAYEIAFIIREAQQLAVSGQTADDLTEVQKQRYGVAFSLTTSGEVNKQAIVLYKDNNDNARYDANDEDQKTYRLDSRFEIVDLTTSNTSRQNMRVVFERPLFDAKFYRESANQVERGTATIVIRPVGKDTPERIITVSSAGQVSVPSN